MEHKGLVIDLPARDYLFKEFPKNKRMGPTIKSYYSTCTKYLIDADEMFEWGEDNHAGNDDSLYTPFKKVWIEFRSSANQMQALPWWETDLGFDMFIYAAGFDLERNTMFAVITDWVKPGRRLMLSCLSIDGSREFNNPDMPADLAPLFMMLRTKISIATKYLQPDNVEFRDKTYSIGKTMRKGRLVDRVARFIVASRKAVRYESTPNDDPTNVDWQHRWQVCGHWRTVKGIGKDQQGNPVRGFTWVNEHVKGPDDKPLILKTRVVVDEE